MIVTVEDSSRAFYRAWNEQDFDILEKIIDPEFHPDWVLMPEKGPALLRKEINYISKAIPDINYEIKKLSIDGQSVWVWYRMTGTQKGEFFGFPPSNKTFIHDGASLMFYNSENKLIDRMGFYCFEDIFRQLGYAPNYWKLHQYLKDYKEEEDN